MQPVRRLQPGASKGRDNGSSKCLWEILYFQGTDEGQNRNTQVFFGEYFFVAPLVFLLGVGAHMSVCVFAVKSTPL